MNVADLLSRHLALEATAALSNITLDVSCLTLSSADDGMLSAVVIRCHAALPPPAAAQHTRTDMPDSTAPPAATQPISDSSALAAVPAVSDHATLGVLTLQPMLTCSTSSFRVTLLTPDLLLQARHLPLKHVKAYATGGKTWSHQTFVSSNALACKNCMVPSTQGMQVSLDYGKMSIGFTIGQAGLLRSVHTSRVARPVKWTSQEDNTPFGQTCFHPDSPNSPGTI